MYSLYYCYSGAAVVYANPDDDVKVENEYEKKRTHYLQLIAGQEKVATPEDYDDEALYTKMTQQYYVNYFVLY